MIKRIVATLVLLFSVLYLPAWITLPGVVFFFFYFEKFYEGLALVLLMDLLYGVPDPRFFNIQIFTFILVSILFFIIMILKKRMRFYR